MRSLARMARRTGRALQRMLSQVIVSVAAAISVALITNAYLDQRSSDAAATAGEADRVAAEQPAMQPHAAPVIAAGLPPLETVTILDRPIQGSPASGAEVFPGVAADSPLAKAVAAARENEPTRQRRFFGFRLPFSATAG
jgi:hypothetical protein